MHMKLLSKRERRVRVVVDNNSDALRRTAMLRTNTACRFHATVGMAGPPAAYTLRAADAPLTHALNIFSFLFLYTFLSLEILMKIQKKWMD